ncbi:sensor histidine kinase [Lysinibacillus sp. fkY74-1]|uniref:histidine kinase n=3 Tax=Lysinibacillus TaxID=400634 RepID=B1HY90_LYSSC|nr:MULTISPECIES: sensor histidine kinase [Lysinibacillus]MBE5082561.1 sensor histidine kinase [Bacillus thuringiensis]ACA38351.1 sensor histidine kinase [Lysinibacillus sphaericus C3-41]AMO31351.1 two-component sensor histidine kinase [Lysinibacillus sphaericus]AMR89538.1 two-component sensor histidine kinase [Lysinibacillus sphaericus]ANA47609.1 two-component sensor histidine kinase [Lysinibacillus sphaericus]
MIIILFIIILVLIGIVIFQWKTKKEQNQTVQYMYEKLQIIVQEQSNEKILVTTSNTQVQQLLISINAWLDYHQKVQATHRKMEDSMKKMLANISHDLKTPLTVVLGYIEMLQLQGSASEEERQRLLAGVHAKTLEVLKIIHTFFDLAKLEAGDTDYPITKINVCEISRKNILSFYDMVTSMGLDINITIPETPMYALGNEEALNRVLNNLLSNALAYGADGNVMGLTIRNDDTSIYIDVWDCGKGIDEYHIDNVFERMYTLEDSRNKSFQGSGLGLTITKRLVEMMDGSIQLSSIPYKKTIFTIALKRMTY